MKQNSREHSIHFDVAFALLQVAHRPWLIVVAISYKRNVEIIFTKKVQKSEAFYHINKENSVIVVSERKKEKAQFFIIPSWMRIFVMISWLVLKDILDLVFDCLYSVAAGSEKGKFHEMEIIHQ